MTADPHRRAVQAAFAREGEPAAKPGLCDCEACLRLRGVRLFVAGEWVGVGAPVRLGADGRVYAVRDESA